MKIVLDLALDRLELEQYGESVDETSISIGKYVAGDIYIEVDKSITGDAAEVSVEKLLTPKISIETEADSKGEKGFKLKWKWDY